jgi:Mg-chelatase subunit ChlD
MKMRIGKLTFTFFLALLVFPGPLPARFSEEARSNRLRGGGYREEAGLDTKGKEKAQPGEGVEFRRKENILIILDASGSMWGQVSLRGSDKARARKCKIEIARKVLEEYVEDLDEERVNVGLRVFGRHRERGCRDSQLVIPVGPLNKEAFKREVHEVRPGHLGKTPIAYSLRRALVDISTAHDIQRFVDTGELSGSKKSIILITDGKEGCDTPEEVEGLAHDLRHLGVDIVEINVIALRVPEQRKHGKMAEPGIQLDMEAHLRRITRGTEGQYISVEAKPSMTIEEFERQLRKSVGMAVPASTGERFFSLLYQGIDWINGFISTHMAGTIIPSVILFFIFFIFAMKWFFRK